MSGANEATAQPRAQRASLQRQNARVTGRRDIVGPNETLVGVKLPPPWDVRVPRPADPDFVAAQDKAWDILGSALQGFISSTHIKSALAPNSVESFASVPNMFRLRGFAPQAIPALRTRAGILFVSNDPGVVSVRSTQPAREEMLMHPSQIGLENPGGVSYTDIDGLQHLSAKDVDIDISGAWLRTVGSPETVVAIIDDGIDLSTPELKANVYTNTKEIPCNGLDDDSNGFLDDYQGYDAELKTGCPQLVKRIVLNPEILRIRGFGVHGTAMALALASPPLSSTSTITGVAPGVRFIPVSTGPSIDRGLSHAYAYIIAMKRAGVPIRMVNLSIGQSNPLPWACSTTTKTGESLTILGELLASGLTVVAAAGNEGSNNDTTPVCPSNLARGHEGVISVGAVDFEGKLPFFSNFGEKSVTISAPGTAIYTGYGYQTGTSIATALVSGVVALMYSANPQLTPAEVKRIIIETAKMPDLNLPTQSRGIISAGRALNAVPGRWGPALKKPRF